MSTQETPERLCHNCGRPKGHHDHGPCHYALAQPETMWTAVISPALDRVAAEQGLDPVDVYLAAYDHFVRRAM